MTDEGFQNSQEAAPEEGEVGLAQIKELAGFMARAPRRHKRLAAFTLLLVLGIGFLAAWLWPRSYGCQVRILAQRDVVLPALGNPGRAIPNEPDSPTRNAADTILQRENIVAAVKQLDLVDRWDATRQPLPAFKDKVFGSIFGKKSDEDKLRDMIGTLEKRAWVSTDDSSITLAIDWPDGNLAYDIVTFLQKNFLEAKYDRNVNVIREAIRILEERAKPQAAELDAVLADLEKIEADRRAAAGVSAPANSGARPYRGGGGRRPATGAGAGTAPAPATAGVGGSGDADTAAELEDVRHRIRQLKEEREKELLDAQAKLADARTTQGLGPLHPTVVALTEKISQLSEPPPELQALTTQERQLVAVLAGPPTTAPAPAPTDASTGTGTPPPNGVPTAPSLFGAPPPAPGGFASPPTTGLAGRVPTDLRDDPEVSLARQKLQVVTAKYNDLLSRIESANIELDVARAAFKYQYTVVRPAELPRGPTKPNVMLIMLAAIVMSIVLSMAVPGLLDLARGRVLEPWQVERTLNLPLLGELNPPPS